MNEEQTLKPDFELYRTDSRIGIMPVSVEGCIWGRRRGWLPQKWRWFESQREAITEWHYLELCGYVVFQVVFEDGTEP